MGYRRRLVNRRPVDRASADQLRSSATGLQEEPRRRENVKQPTLGGLRTMGALTALSVVATLVMVSCGSSTAGSSAKPLFVGINKSADQQYFIDQQQAFKAEIEKKGGQVKLYNAKLDANTGISEVNDAISAGAKGIAITVPDQTIGPAVSKSAADAKVALVATDDALTTAGVKPDNIIAVGLGAYEACKPWAANQPSGWKAALYISGKDVGIAAADALWDKVQNNVALPASTIAKTTIVHPNDYAQLFPCTK